MIPSSYVIVGLLVCLAALAAVILAPACRAFKRAWFVVAAVIAILYAGDKPEPPPTPPSPPASVVTIKVLDTTVSNVTLSVTSTTNELGLASMWQARRLTVLGETKVWGPWEAVSDPSVISSTNSTDVVTGRFVNGRRDTQLRLVYGSGNLTNEVTP